LSSDVVTPVVDPIPPEALLVINDGAYTTSILSVTLSFRSFEDSEGFDDITEMKISNTPSFSNTEWVTFSQDIPWQLATQVPGELGDVYVLLRDAAGNEGYTLGRIEYQPALTLSEIIGPDFGKPNLSYSFTVSVDTTDTLGPITYTWSADNQSVVTQTSGLSSTVSFNWSVLGTNSITVVAMLGNATLTTSHVITITDEQNLPPIIPHTPNPEDGATDVSLETALSWSGGDVDNDIVTYTVSFGTDEPLPMIAVVTNTNVQPTVDLLTDTQYMWRITATDGISVSVSPKWHFTTTQSDILTSTVVTANFTANPIMGTVPLSVQFTDQSLGAINAWQWDFGDGNTSTSQAPTHTYVATGSYTVSLSISGANDSDIMTRTNYINVLNPGDFNYIYLPLVIKN
jgi:PKD repeat protein